MKYSVKTKWLKKNNVYSKITSSKNKAGAYMRILTHNITNPYFNLAAEEYFLTQSQEELVLLWRNDRSVIVGKNQNTLEEINRAFVEAHKIPVVRRLTGGGAVFHDLGNLNYTLIQTSKPGMFGDYGSFTRPICSFLQNLGVPAQLNGRNDLVIQGKKFSGNAQTVKNGKIMHHGTILFQSDLWDVSQALKPNELKLQSKGIVSVHSHVTNISEHLSSKMTIEKFIEQLYNYLQDAMEATPIQLSQEDVEQIQRLAQEKYETWEWNYGMSPEYHLQKAQRFPCGTVEIRLNVNQGVICQAVIYGDFFGVKPKEELEQGLVGVRHERKALEQVLREIPISDYIAGMDAQELIQMLL